MEYIRIKYGADKPSALLSRGVAGIAGKSLIYTLPGSLKAVEEYMTEILKTLEHTILMQYGVDTHKKH
jgi:molybdopterin biosynthesis enzyme MoaB